MSLKPRNVSWIGFTAEQGKLLDRMDFYGNNEWARTSQLDMMMPSLLREAEVLGLTMAQIKDAMASIGYHDDALHQLDRWHSKVTTGRFGR